MLDINLLRRDLDGVIARLETRKKPQPFLDVERFTALEAERKRMQTRTEELQARRNALSKQIGQLQGQGRGHRGADGRGGRHRRRAEGRRRAARGDPGRAVADADERAEPAARRACRSAPTKPRNVEVRRWGTPRDVRLRAEGPRRPRRAARASTSRPAPSCRGSRFTFLRGPAARLHRALAQFMLDVQTSEHGYTECYTPYIVNREILEGTGQLPKFKDDMFWVLRGGDEEQRRAVPDLHLGDLADQHRARADPRRRRAADQADRAQPVLPPRSRQRRPRHARHDPPAPVRQGRDGADRASRAELRGARADGRPRRGRAAEARAAVPRGRCCAPATWASASTKTYDLEVWLPAQDTYREISSCSQLRGLPGAPHAGALPQRARQDRARAHAQRLGPGGRAARWWRCSRTTRRPTARSRVPDGAAPVPGRRGGAASLDRLEFAAASAPPTRGATRHRRGGRVVECAGLEIRLRVLPYRGFESLPLRHPHVSPQHHQGPFWSFFDLGQDVDQTGAVLGVDGPSLIAR